jgi:DNA helicase-2/ATP-dependent DNA helicase PcrA
MPNSSPLSAIGLAEMMGLNVPTAEQVAVIEAPLEPMLVVAGAGSGKTETMASRVVWLIANGLVEPRQVLGLTFTRKAAHELGERIGARLRTLGQARRAEGLALPPGLERGGSGGDLLGGRVQVHTYNGFALDLVSEHALRVGLDAEFSMMSPSATWQLAHEIVENSEDLHLDASPATVTAALVSLTSALADHLVTPVDLEEELVRIGDHLEQLPLQAPGGRRKVVPKPVAEVLTALASRRELVPLLERFEQERTAQAALDFSDQVRLAARIAHEVPEAGALERELHPVVLLDEFQDTSVAQLRMLADLYGPGHAACAVGDPQQAIYGWRGASAASLDAFSREFATEQVPVLQRTLATSWRNDEAVLAAANRVASPLREASAAVRIPELIARPGAGPGSVRIHEAADEVAEAGAIGRWILERRAAWTGDVDAGDAGAGGDVPPPSAAVLVRARKQIPVIAQELTAQGLEVQVLGIGGLLDRPEVADVRALLEVLDDPGRGDALMRLLTGPRVRLGVKDLAVLGRWRDRVASRRRSGRARTAAAAPAVATDEADAVTLADAVDDLPPVGWTDGDGRELSTLARERLADLSRLLRSLRRRLSLPLPDLVWEAVRLLEVDLALLENWGGLEALESLRSHAAEFERTARRPGLTAYLALLEVSEEKEAGLPITGEAAETDPAAVTILTMHSSKGLEWDMVAVAGLAEGDVPSYDPRRATTGEDGSVRVPTPGWLGPLAEAPVPSSLRGDAEQVPQLEWLEADTQVEAEEIIKGYRLDCGDESLREDRRLVYVALTRARRDLLLTSAAYRSGRKNPRMRSRFLSEMIDQVPEQFRVREEVPEGNPLDAEPTWTTWPPPPGEAEDRRRRAAELLAETAPTLDDNAAPDDTTPDDLVEPTRRVIADLVDARRALQAHSPVRLSASQIVARAQDPEQAARALLRPLPRRPSAAARRGTTFHAWLEQRYDAASLLDIEDLADLADLADDEATDDADRDVSGGDGASRAGDGDARALTHMRELFEASPWAPLVPIAVEEPVMLRIGPLAVRGVIDAVFPDPEPGADPDAVVIVDWKTGRRPTGKRRTARALQLSVYRLAWHERTGLPLSRIRTVFHYVSTGESDEIRRHPSRERIARMLTEGEPEPQAGERGDH